MATRTAKGLEDSQPVFKQPGDPKNYRPISLLCNNLKSSRE